MDISVLLPLGGQKVEVNLACFRHTHGLILHG